MTNPMVRRMAKAMQSSPAWPAVFKGGSAEILAVAALKAMKDPTPEMFTAGQKAVSRMDPKAVKTVDWEEVWAAMIREALNPESAT